MLGADSGTRDGHRSGSLGERGSGSDFDDARSARIDAAALPGNITNALAPEQSLLLDEYFLHRRRQVINEDFVEILSYICYFDTVLDRTDSSAEEY